MKSISFDRAANFYDCTRGHPPEVSEKVAASLAAQLPLNAHILEVGVGTGRIARPLLKHGLRITGVDISRKMMERLRAQLAASANHMDLIEADANWLPFSEGEFEATVSVHVIHLVPDWLRLLTEIRRVNSKPGSIILGYDWRPDDNPSGLLRKKWDEIVSANSNHVRHDFTKRFQNVRQTLTREGGRLKEWTAAEWITRPNLRDEIEKIESRTWSATWQVEEDQFQKALEQIREWAVETFGTLDYTYDHPWKFIWQRFQWDG
jgi:ubiquinone/menaquinone biosynthesis C-methylase UbiE